MIFQKQVTCLIYLCMRTIQRCFVTSIQPVIRRKLILNWKKIYRWLCSNKLSLNVSKIKFACFHAAKGIVAYPELKINSIIIDRVAEFNFLGLIIFSNMKWKNHRSYSTKSFQNHIMYRFKFILPADVLLTTGAPNRGGVGGSQPPLNFGWGG